MDPKEGTPLGSSAPEATTPEPPAPETRTTGGAAADAPLAQAAPSTAGPSSAKKPRRLGRKILAGVGIVLVVAVVAFLVWAVQPNEAGSYDEGIDYDLRERNTLAYGALGALGITDPVVAMRLDDASVTYDLLRSPANDEWTDIEGDPVSPDDMQRGVIGAIAEVTPEVRSFSVRQMEGGVLNQTWTVQMSDVVAFFAGELSFEQFEARIVKS